MVSCVALAQWHNTLAFLLQFYQHIRGDRFNFRHDIMVFPLDELAQCFAIQHVDDVRAVGNVHGWRVGVTIDGNDFHTQALAFNGHFFTQFSRT
jgi:hypothetical protein